MGKCAKAGRDNRRPMTRSEVMSRVRAKDTRPEMLVRRAIWSSGLRYRLHDKRLPGNPDIVLPSRRIAVFVHGCFWHRHPGCKSTRTPKTRVEFWETKFQGNVARDARVTAELERLGWTVIIIWECDSRDESRLRAIVSEIAARPVVGGR